MPIVKQRGIGKKKDGKREYVVNTGPGLTKQSFKDQVDINKIIARANKTGMIDVNQKRGFYGDVSHLTDYQDALNKVNEARELFQGMSSKIRNRFDNDPKKLIDFLDDPQNLEEARALGIVATPEPEPAPPEPAPAPPAPPAT